MGLGFIKVGVQGGGGLERRETQRLPRRETVRKPAYASPYADNYAREDYPRTYDNAPVRAHYEVIAPKPPGGRERRGASIAPGGGRGGGYPKVYDNAPPVNAHYQLILPKPTPAREQPKHHHHQRPKAASYQQNHYHGRGGQEIARAKSPPRRLKQRHEPNKGIASYREIKVLGEGGQGECHLVERRSDGRKFVRKISHTFMEKPSGKPVEAYILQDVLSQHERSIKLIEYTIAQDSLIAIYEFYPGGDLVSYLPNGRERPSERFVWWIFVQLADVLAYLHEGFDHKNPSRAPRDWQPVIHCDIKPDNIFLREHRRDSAYPNVVLGDFGYATLKPGKYTSGTKAYHSPEIKETGNTTCSDVWALGATIHELVHGYAPEGRFPYPLPKSFSSSLENVVSSCLDPDPYYRISARQLVQRVYKEYSRWR